MYPKYGKGLHYVRMESGDQHPVAFGGQLIFTVQCTTVQCTTVQCAVLWSHVVCLSPSVHPSVRPSVTLVDCDHIGWNSSKIISRLGSMGRSLSADPNIMDLLQRDQPEIWSQSDPPPVDLSIGDIQSQIAVEWLQIAQWSRWRAYRKPPSLFRMVPLLTPTISPAPKMASHMAISLQLVIQYTSCLVLG